ncbi:unnamed protein product [Lasius platythorax]|uniref:Uncharacterized protein n=1 Tax=Lasius platythorax TaxID=488582 RepID=A0AAV2MYQ1_9HYME
MDVFDLAELSDMIMCYGKARRNGREATIAYTNSGFLADNTHTTQCLLDFFVLAFKKRDFFVLGTLVEEGAT